MAARQYQFESLEHLLAECPRPGDDPEAPVRCVIFGGTGAVGGAVVLELARLILVSAKRRATPLRGEIIATGLDDKEITKFVSRLYLALEPYVPQIEKVTPLRHYRLADRLDLRFDTLRIGIPEGLQAHVETVRAEQGEGADLEEVFGAFFADLPRPFLEFVQGLADPTGLDAVLVGIPLPSVATYTTDVIDRLAASYGLDHETQNRIKDRFLRNLVQGLVTIREHHARHAIMAHTTAVGGMYRVDREPVEIRLGFAHSAIGKLLADKKYFADVLTRLYVELEFDVLVTAAAIGVDAVEFNVELPLVHGVRRVLAARAAWEAPSIPATDLDRGKILRYPSQRLPFDDAGTGEPTPVNFGEGKPVRIPVAIRSGENGLFSVANCMALYHVMKVAIPEELATVCVRQILFGPERRRGWFEDGLCYYTETENAQFALRLLESDQRLVHAHLGPFAIQAYQALGSATHQARLHELGLLVTLVRLLDLRARFESLPEEQLEQAVSDLDEFLWDHTRLPFFDDVLAIGSQQLGALLGQLCEVDSKEDAGELLGYRVRERGRREPGREKFLARLATHIQRYLWTITSLGTPIVYRTPGGEDRLLIGPYVAPLDTAVGQSDTLRQRWQELATAQGVSYEVARDWVIVNNGFCDLRPHALASSAQRPGPELAANVLRTEDPAALEAWLAGRPVGSYFTTCGLVATELRLRRLYDRIRTRRVELGTRETWKNLFFCDVSGRLVLAPGLVETLRMYTEGLGKITGTEQLWPGWGY